MTDQDELDMRVGVRYIVTRASIDLEFQVGDRIRLLEDGDIINAAVSGWMPAEDVPAATRGMAVVVDVVWTDMRRTELERQLAALHA